VRSRAIRLQLSGCWLLLLLVFYGCDGDGISGGSPPMLGANSAVLETSVETIPAEPGQGEPFSVTLQHRVTPPRVRLGAYLMELRFDPARVEFASAAENLTPSQVANTSTAPEGLITVAGAMLEGFSESILFEADFRALGAGVSAADFRLTIREAVDVQLRPIPSSGG
jgi:hypothetical protein